MTSGGALEQLLGGYLHQDWDLDYESVWAAVADFVNIEPADTVEEARRELRELLDKGYDEDKLREEAGRRGCFYRPQGDGLTYAEWLAQLSRALEAR